MKILNFVIFANFSHKSEYFIEKGLYLGKKSKDFIKHKKFSTYM